MNSTTSKDKKGGLGAFAKSVTSALVSTNGVSAFSTLPISKVYPNPIQPRKAFEVEELAEDIQVNGLIQPIAVVKRANGYMIVAGERRYQAHLFLNRKTIKTHIIVADDQKVQELALIENIQREDLTDFEIAKHIASLWASGNYPKKQDLAKAIGKPPSYLSKAFKAIHICEAVQRRIEWKNDNIGLEILQELSKVKDKAKQCVFYQERATREEIRAFVAKEKEKKSIPQNKEISLAKVKPIFEFKGISKYFDNGEKYVLTHTSEEKVRLSMLGTFMKLGVKYKITIEEM